MRVVSYTRTTSYNPESIPSNIIALQNERIQNYVKEHQLKIVNKYSDRKRDKETCDAFKELVSDGVNHKFDLVIVDSLNRTGTNPWQAKEVLFNTFHMAGIYFIVVEDDFCSVNKSYQEIESYFKRKLKQIHNDNLVQFKIQQLNNGIITSGLIDYGYKLSKDKKIIVDPTSSKIVKRIFELYKNNKSCKEIAHTLEAEKVPTCRAYRNGIEKYEFPYKWSSGVIRQILKKESYTGHKTINYRGVLYNFEYEAIISKEEFEIVQKLIKKPLNSKSTSQNLKYRQKIYEEDGINHLVACKPSGRKCWYVKHSNNYGSRLYEDELDAIVLNSIKAEAKLADHVYESIVKCEKEKILIQEKMNLRDLCLDLAKLEKERIRLDDSTELQEILNQENSLNESILEKINDINLLEKTFEFKNKWLNTFSNLDVNNITLDRTALNLFVDHILVKGVQVQKVFLNYQEWKECLPKEWRE